MAKSKKVYNVAQNEGRISWRIEETWDGGVVRSPYNSKETAIAKEESIARENGFIDELTLEKVGAESTASTNAFEKNKEGSWQCIKACSINIDNKEITFTKGMKFAKGDKLLGIDVVKWLDEHHQK